MKRRRVPKPVQWPFEPPFRVVVTQSAARDARRRAIAQQIRHPFGAHWRERWWPLVRPASAVLALAAILAASLAYSHREPPDAPPGGQSPVSSIRTDTSPSTSDVGPSRPAATSQIDNPPAALSPQRERTAASDAAEVGTTASTVTSMQADRRSGALPRPTMTSRGASTSGGTGQPTPIGPTISGPSSSSGATPDAERTSGPATITSQTVQQSSASPSPSSSLQATSAPTLPPPPTGAQPVAVSDSATVQTDKDTKLLVLGNDRAEPGAILEPSSLQILGQPAHASSVKVHDDHLHYQAVKGYVGGDSISYRICSSSGACATGQVSIDVVARL